MNIGLSLPLGYLTGANDSADAICFSEAFGQPRDCLADLSDHGITSIELQGFGSDASADSVRGAVGCILGSGLHLTLHGYLSNHTTGHLSVGVHTQLLSSADLMKERREDTVMVVHALAIPGASHRTMVEATVAASERLAEDIRTCDLPITTSLEISRYHGVEFPGTTYDALLEIARHLRNSGSGSCWDMGHTRSSVQQGRLPSDPPTEFIKRVNHTHVHGVSSRGDTHRPLTEPSPHIVSWINQLKSFGYDGTYNLELYPSRWGAKDTVRSKVLSSVRYLRKIVEQSPPGDDPKAAPEE